jgi:choline monooxygenase
MTTTPETNPAAWHRDPDIWARERRAVFARAWQYVAHESALAQQGAYVAETLAGYPVVVVRDGESVRGFHNVCRHRAGPLVRDSAGVCQGALVCQYHGWRYALDGRLRSARDFGAAADFDPRDYALFPVRVASWRGLVFASLAPDTPPLDEVLAPLERRMAGRSLSDLRPGARRTHSLACNWKTYVENYLEGYHVPDVHPALNAQMQSELYRVEVEGRVVLQDAPARDGSVYDGLWAWVWPNLAINVYRDSMMIEHMAPIGHAATQLHYTFLTEGGAPPDEGTLAMSEVVTSEDKWIVERVQENLDAGVYGKGRLSRRHEGAVAAFQGWVREALGNAP